MNFTDQNDIQMYSIMYRIIKYIVGILLVCICFVQCSPNSKDREKIIPYIYFSEYDGTISVFSGSDSVMHLQIGCEEILQEDHYFVNKMSIDVYNLFKSSQKEILPDEAGIRLRIESLLDTTITVKIPHVIISDGFIIFKNMNKIIDRRNIFVDFDGIDRKEIAYYDINNDTIINCYSFLRNNNLDYLNIAYTATKKGGIPISLFFGDELIMQSMIEIPDCLETKEPYITAKVISGPCNPIVEKEKDHYYTEIRRFL